MAQIAQITHGPDGSDAQDIRLTQGSSAGATLSGPTGQAQDHCVAETGELRDLANLSWPDRPLNLMAADIMDLEGQGAMKTISAMIELTLHLGRDTFDILHLEDLFAGAATSADCRERIYQAQTLVLNAARSMRTATPKVSLEDSGAQFHLRVRFPSNAAHRH